MERRTKIIVLFSFFVLLTGSFFLYREQQPVQQEYAFPSPEEVVRLYFTAWNEHGYADVYSTLADDFKRSEPTAHNLGSFRTHVEEQRITEIVINSIKETSNDGATAHVTYDVQLIKTDTIFPLQGTFILGNKQADIIRGWKILYPYGDAP